MPQGFPDTNNLEMFRFTPPMELLETSKLFNSLTMTTPWMNNNNRSDLSSLLINNKNGSNFQTAKEPPEKSLSPMIQETTLAKPLARKDQPKVNQRNTILGNTDKQDQDSINSTTNYLHMITGLIKILSLRLRIQQKIKDNGLSYLTAEESPEKFLWLKIQPETLPGLLAK